MNTLKFANKYKDPILNGEKTATIRLHGEHDAVAGQVHRFEDQDGKAFAKGFIPVVATTRAREALGYVDAVEAYHHQKDTEGLVDTLNGFYETDVTTASLVDVLPYHVVDILV